MRRTEVVLPVPRGPMSMVWFLFAEVRSSAMYGRSRSWSESFKSGTHSHAGAVGFAVGLPGFVARIVAYLLEEETVRKCAGQGFVGEVFLLLLIGDTRELVGV